MVNTNLYQTFRNAFESNSKLLAVLIDPEDFNSEQTAEFLRKVPSDTTHILVGGSTVPDGATEALLQELKLCTSKPVLLFPGDHSQISPSADGILFLSLLSGRNPEYLVGQQVRAVPRIKETDLEVIPTAYLLIDGGNHSAVSRVTETEPMDQLDVEQIVHTAKAGELMGSKLVYLEAGSGADKPVSETIISAVKKEIEIPLIVGGGIRTRQQQQTAYKAGADMVVMGTVFENQSTI